MLHIAMKVQAIRPAGNEVRYLHKILAMHGHKFTQLALIIAKDNGSITLYTFLVHPAIYNNTEYYVAKLISI